MSLPREGWNNVSFWKETTVNRDPDRCDVCRHLITKMRSSDAPEAFKMTVLFPEGEHVSFMGEDGREHTEKTEAFDANICRGCFSLFAKLFGFRIR